MVLCMCQLAIKTKTTILIFYSYRSVLLLPHYTKYVKSHMYWRCAVVFSHAATYFYHVNMNGVKTC